MNLYYRWSKEFLEAGKKRLAGDAQREATSDEVKALRTLAQLGIPRSTFYGWYRRFAEGGLTQTNQPPVNPARFTLTVLPVKYASDYRADGKSIFLRHRRTGSDA